MDPDAPAVTAITIGHSVRDELAGCFDSLREHANVSLQTILVDNASTDGTPGWVAEAYPEVEVVELDENIWCAARNHALPRAKGEYILFIDSDARLTPGALGVMIEALEANSGWGMVAPRLLYPDGTLQLSCRRFPPRLLPVARRPPLNRWLEDSRPVSRYLMRDADHSRPRPILYALGACLLFRTSTARSLGSLDFLIALGGCDDIDWGVRFWQAGHEVHYLPQATVIHDYRRASSTHLISRGAWRHLRAFARVQRKYFGRRRELLRLCDELDRRAARSTAGS